MSQEILDNRGRGLASWSMPSVHPEGRKFAVAAATLTLIFALLAWETLAWPMGGLTLWILAFFRDPARVTRQDERLVVAPADGLCTQIELVPPPVELAGPGGLGSDPLYRISIFMSVFDVHINRAPIGGTIRRIVYISGKFLNADLDKSSDENERQHIMIERGDGARVGITQIAGIVARRIVPFIKEGDFVAVGQRVGLIRFGSRVDVYLPQGTAPAVVKGQRITAGETVLAMLGEAPVLEGIAH